MADSEIVSELRKIRLAVAELVELQRTLIAVLAQDEEADSVRYDLDGNTYGERDQSQPL